MTAKTRNIFGRLVAAISNATESLKHFFLYRNFLPAKKHLLIVKLDSIGDYLLFRNFLVEIRSSETYRGYKITLCGNNWWQQLSEEIDKDSVDDFIWVDYSRLDQKNYFNKVTAQLRKKRFEVALSPTFSRSHYPDAITLQSGAKVKIGQEGDSVNLHPDQKAKNDQQYTLLVPAKELLSFEFERNRYFFQQILKDENLVKLPFLSYPGEKQNRVIICAGAKDKFRQWNPQFFYELSVYLKDKLGNPEFVICGSAGETEIAARIIASGNEVTFKDLTGKLNLNELAQLIAKSRLLLSNDSAPYHFGSLVGTPLICLSNGNNYKRFCPYPSTYRKPNLELFPSQVYNANEELVLKLQQQGSSLDINLITPSDVIKRIEKEDFLNEVVNRYHKP